MMRHTRHMHGWGAASVRQPWSGATVTSARRDAGVTTSFATTPALSTHSTVVLSGACSLRAAVHVLVTVCTSQVIATTSQVKSSIPAIDAASHHKPQVQVTQTKGQRGLLEGDIAPRARPAREEQDPTALCSARVGRRGGLHQHELHGDPLLRRCAGVRVAVSIRAHLTGRDGPKRPDRRLSAAVQTRERALTPCLLRQ